MNLGREALAEPLSSSTPNLVSICGEKAELAEFIGANLSEAAVWPVDIETLPQTANDGKELCGSGFPPIWLVRGDDAGLPELRRQMATDGTTSFYYSKPAIPNISPPSLYVRKQNNPATMHQLPAPKHVVCFTFQSGPMCLSFQPL
jgi:hypothetical protein